jgi:hypothetical protein
LPSRIPRGGAAGGGRESEREVKVVCVERELPHLYIQRGGGEVQQPLGGVPAQGVPPPLPSSI